MNVVATTTSHEVSRPPSVLAPLIKEQVQLGDLAAEEAGMPYYRKAGGLMEEARPSVKIKGEQTFEDYCTKASGKSYTQCLLYMKAHKEEVKVLEHARKKGKSRGRPGPQLSDSLRGLEGRPTTGRSYSQPWIKPVDDLAEAARKQQQKAAEDRATEQKLKQQLARKLIDIGYKILIKELHPDKMLGSKEATQRLNEVRKRLMAVYG